MLDILRKRASSWVIKFLLGSIVVVFIFFFGSSALRAPSQSNPVVAEVDGDPIYKSTVDGLIELQKASNPEFSKLPDSFMEYFRSSVLNSLIEDKITTKAASVLGLRVSNKELGEEIQKDPGLVRDGKFDLEYYKQVILPAYKQRYDVDYEDLRRRGLQQGQLHTLFDQALIISDPLLRKIYPLEETKVTLKRVVLRAASQAKNFEPSTESISARSAMLKASIPAQDPETLQKNSKDELIREEGARLALALSEELYPLFVNKKLDEKIVQKHGLDVRDLPETSIADSSSLLPNATPEQIASLFRLTKEKPHPLKPIQIGDDIYFFELKDRVEAKGDDFDAWRTNQVDRFSKELSSQFYKNWYSELSQKSSIEIHAAQ